MTSEGKRSIKDSQCCFAQAASRGLSVPRMERSCNGKLGSSLCMVWTWLLVEKWD